jgi:hypothetical protein
LTDAAERPARAGRSAVISSFTSPGNPYDLAGRDQGLVVIGGDAKQQQNIHGTSPFLT